MAVSRDPDFPVTSRPWSQKWPLGYWTASTWRGHF